MYAKGRGSRPIGEELLDMTDAEVYAGAAVMGVVAGMRSMAAPAMMGRLAHSGDFPVSHSEISFFNCPKAAYTMMVLAAGEAIADKLPFMPKRTKSWSLVGRMLSGALSGAAVCSARKKSVAAGAALGAAAAVGATFAAHKLRERAVEGLHIPDAAIAVVEDVIAAGCGTLVLSRLKPA